jgi:hypothetical protein
VRRGLDSTTQHTGNASRAGSPGALKPPEDVPPVDTTAIARDLKRAAADVKALLAGTTTQARQMLRQILDGKRLDAEPIDRDGRLGYRLSGELCFGRLLPTDVFRAAETAMTSNKVVPQRDSKPCFSHDHVFASSITWFLAA